MEVPFCTLNFHVVRKNADDKFELSLAFMDGDEAVAEDMIVPSNLTFEVKVNDDGRCSPRVKFTSNRPRGRKIV